MNTDPLASSGQALANAFGVDVAMENNDRTVIVRVNGELDLTTTPRFEASVNTALGALPDVLVVDLTEVTFLASCALSALVAAHQAGADRTMVRVVAAGRETLRPLQLTGLHESLAIYPSLQAALAAE